MPPQHSSKSRNKPLTIPPITGEAKAETGPVELPEITGEAQSTRQQVKQYAWLAFTFLLVPLLPARTIAISQKPAYTLSYGSWSYNLPFVPQNPVLDAKVVECESRGVNVSRPDSNGRISDGVAQFNRGADGTIQSGTWGWMEKLSGITGDPRYPDDAIHMLDWAISDGLGDHWTCYRRIVDSSTR